MDILRREDKRLGSPQSIWLGYLLAFVGAEDLAASLETALAERVKFLVALAPWTSMTGAARDFRWAVAVNVNVGLDK